MFIIIMAFAGHISLIIRRENYLESLLLWKILINCLGHVWLVEYLWVECINKFGIDFRL